MKVMSAVHGAVLYKVVAHFSACCITQVSSHAAAQHAWVLSRQFNQNKQVCNAKSNDEIDESGREWHQCQWCRL